MKIIIIAEKNILSGEYIEEMISCIKKTYYAEVIKLVYSKEKVLQISELKQIAADLIITVNLAGFEQSTLTDGVVYNLVNSKFLHLLFQENLENEKYLAKQLSISMFFYCQGQKYYEYLLKNYPDLPYLKLLEKENSGITKAVMSAIGEVVQECHL